MYTTYSTTAQQRYKNFMSLVQLLRSPSCEFRPMSIVQSTMFLTSINRTGLPPELSGLWGELSDSDEEYDDEDDEDSNGA